LARYELLFKTIA